MSLGSSGNAIIRRPRKGPLCTRSVGSGEARRAAGSGGWGGFFRGAARTQAATARCLRQFGQAPAIHFHGLAPALRGTGGLAALIGLAAERAMGGVMVHGVPSGWAGLSTQTWLRPACLARCRARSARLISAAR